MTNEIPPLGNIKLIEDAEPGTSLTYHVGFIGHDHTIVEEAKRVGGKIPENIVRRLDQAEIALRFYAQGLVELTQIKLDPYKFAYIATRRRVCTPPLIFNPPTNWKDPSRFKSQ